MTGPNTTRRLQAFVSILPAAIFTLILSLNNHAFSQSAPKSEFTLRMVGNTRVMVAWPVLEWFTHEAEVRSNGRVKIQLASSPELGMTGFERVQVLQQGLIDIGDVPPTFVSGQYPLLEAQDLPGIYKDFMQMRKAHMAFQPILQKYQKELGGKFLGSYSYEWNYLFSVKPLTSIQDIKNKKVRTFSVALQDFYTALGAIPENLPVAEMYTGLSRGTVDAVHTASGNAIGLKLWEVAPYVLDVRAGAGPAALIMSDVTWNRLPPDLQSMFVKLGEEFTQRGWDVPEATSAKARQMMESKGFKWTAPAPDWQPALDKAVNDVVIPKWSHRAGPEGVKVFNQILEPITGFHASL